MEALLSDAYYFFTADSQVLILLACLLHAPLGHRWEDFVKEFFGAMALILMQFPAGKWFGRGAWWQAWLWHGVGVVGADWVAGGPNVNPSIALCNVALGKLEYPAFLCRVSAGLAGSLVTFTLCRWIASELQLEPLGGPSFDPAKESLGRAVGHEAMATFVLCMAVFLLNWELPVRRFYLLKQGLTAVVVRFNLQTFTAAGCAMNPMLPTAYAVFKASEGEAKAYAFPSHADHYLCYWGASFAGGLLAALLYSLAKGLPFFGFCLRPVGTTAGAAKEKDA